MDFLKLTLFIFEFNTSFLEQIEYSGYESDVKRRRKEDRQKNHISCSTYLDKLSQCPEVNKEQGFCGYDNKDAIMNRTCSPPTYLDVINSDDLNIGFWEWVENEVQINTPNPIYAEISETCHLNFFDNLESQLKDDNEQEYNHKNNSTSNVDETSVKTKVQAEEYNLANNPSQANKKIHINPQTDEIQLFKDEELVKLKKVMQDLLIEVTKMPSKKNSGGTLLFNRALSFFSEVVMIMCLKIKNGESEKTIITFLKPFFSEVYAVKFNSTDRLKLLSEKRVKLRHKIVELLNSVPSNYSNKIRPYKKLILLEEMLLENLSYKNLRYILILYNILFFLNDNEIESFEKKIDILEDKLNEMPHENHKLDYSGISIKNIFYRIIELNKIKLYWVSFYYKSYYHDLFTSCTSPSSPSTSQSA